MNIAIASGKGGTGKTTLSVSLAQYLVNKGIDVSIYDCDVEEPNVNLFLKIDIKEKRDSSVLIPEIDLDACIGCNNMEKRGNLIILVVFLIFLNICLHLL
jgi:MinD superfamily P-loop ATPase